MRRSLVVPLFEEATRVAACVPSLSDSWANDDRELIFVDDGSTDGTADVLAAVLASTALSARVICLQVNRGKGAAVRAGVAAATGDVIGFVDADLSTSIDEIEKCFGLVESGDADAAVATRARRDSVITSHQPRARELAGKSFNLLVRALGLTSMPDTQCGLEVFTADVAHAVFPALTTERFAFDVEVLARAERLGARIVEVPVEWRHVETSRVRPVRDGGRMAWDAVRIRRAMRRFTC